MAISAISQCVILRGRVGEPINFRTKEKNNIAPSNVREEVGFQPQL